MCTHSRYVTNRYIHQRILVKCGRCPACLQEKANARALKIRNHASSGKIGLFVTLTYSNDFVPFMLKDDANELIIPIYRAKTIVKKYGRTEIVDSSDTPLDFYSNDFYEQYDCRKGLKCLKHSWNRVGVIYYKDIKDFMKRLRKNCISYGITYKITYTSYFEYGGKSLRPHFHLLLWIDPTDEKELRNLIVKSWPFSNWMQKRKSIQVNKDTSSYIASYINSGSDFPVLFKSRSFRPKYSSSKNFGYHQECFSFSSLLEKVERRDLHYYRETIQNGVPVLSAFLFPKSVINRFFPLFKGYKYVTDDEIREFLFIPERITFLTYQRNIKLKWSHDDIHKYYTHLNNCLVAFASSFGISPEDAKRIYPLFFVSVWNTYKSQSLKDSYDNITTIRDYEDFYENATVLSVDKVISDLQNLHLNFQYDYNKRLDVVSSSARLTQLYHRKCKTKVIVNMALSEKDIEY